MTIQRALGTDNIMNRTGIVPALFAANIKRHVIHKDNATLLVVEDNDFHRDFLVRHLQLLGYREIIEAGDGQQTMDLISNLYFKYGME